MYAFFAISSCISFNQFWQGIYGTSGIPSVKSYEHVVWGSLSILFDLNKLAKCFLFVFNVIFLMKVLLIFNIRCRFLMFKILIQLSIYFTSAVISRSVQLQFRKLEVWLNHISGCLRTYLRSRILLKSI